MKLSADGPGQKIYGTVWRPVYVSFDPNSDGIKLTKGDSTIATKPWKWNYSSNYVNSTSIPSLNNIWKGYLKIGVDGSLCTLTNLYINGGDLDEDNANRACWYPCLLYTSPSPRDRTRSRMPSSA